MLDCKLELNPNFSEFKDFLLDIRQNFSHLGNSIHKVRNEIKILNKNGTNLAVKSFKIPNFFNKILYRFFKKTKARKSYEHSLRVGEFAPSAIGYIDFYENGWLKKSYFVSENFSYDFTIREVLLNTNFNDREAIFKEFATFTFELHEAEILHLDYSPGNILIKRNGEHYEFKIVDINRMKFKPLSLDERLKNFNMLWVSDEDISIIVKEYAKLVNADESECIKKAIAYSHALKARKNFKKRLRWQHVAN